MVSVEMRNKFDNLVEKDFMDIAQSAAEAVIQERIKKHSVLVYLSNPDVMIFDPIANQSEYKHITVEYSNGKEIKIMIAIAD